MTDQELTELRGFLRRGEYDKAIPALAERVAADRRVLSEPHVKQWCGQRWRNIFLTEAERDRAAVATATRSVGVSIAKVGLDTRPVRERLAQRFLAQDIDDWRLEMPEATPPQASNAALVFVPGFAHKAIPVAGLADLEDIAATTGMDVLRAETHAFRGAADNVADIKAAVERTDGSVLIGYSKGSVDSLAFLAAEPDTAAKVRAVVTWAGAVGGSPSADDVYARIRNVELGGVLGHEMSLMILKALLPIAQLGGLLDRHDEWDLRSAVRDLTTTERAAFYEEHLAAIDAMDIPIFSVVAQTAAIDVPYFQLQGTLAIGGKVGPNDMQVAVEHAQVPTPMGITLAVCRANHWDLALGAFPYRQRLGSGKLEHPFPRRVAVTATTLLLNELGLI